MSLAMSQSTQERFARDCHAANVCRWKFYQIGKKAVDQALAVAIKANTIQAAHKKACHESWDSGWDSPLVTPWHRDNRQYILIPGALLASTGCMEEASKTWLVDIRASRVLGNRRS